jgi:energy-coupling factor transporter ATP-binding protein EcfA2
MKRINRINIQNFKAFPELQPFELDGKNLLVYGNNGSGKSSLYWALYTFLQCSEKDADGINKYFIPFSDANKDTYQSLRNLYRPDTDDSFVEIELQGEPSIKLAYNNFADLQTSGVKEANKASDFINYKLLHNFYNATHKKELNLWEVFKRDIFPYFSYSGKTYAEWLEDIETNQQYDGRTKGYSQFQARLGLFNREVDGLVSSIVLQANKVLLEKFNISDLKIEIVYSRQLTWGGKFNDPKIKLCIEVKKDDAFVKHHRPQSFLNEASLTRIAISVRLGALLTRLAVSEWKILVLDDMLISLDMSNRMVVSEIILNDDDLKEFQKIILTHDKAFFNILKSATDSSEWNYAEFYKDENILSSKPIIKNHIGDLEKAKYFFEKQEFDACANYLRKEAEVILKKHLNKGLSGEFETLANLINQTKNKIESERLAKFNKLFKKGDLPLEKIKEDFEADPSLSIETKGKLRTLKSHLFNFLIQQSEQDIKLSQILNELQSIKDRVLNPLSHGAPMPHYTQELKEAIEVVEQMYILLNPNPTTV